MGCCCLARGKLNALPFIVSLVISWNARVQLMNRRSNYHLFLYRCLITFAVASGDRLQMPFFLNCYVENSFFDGDESSIQCCVSNIQLFPIYISKWGFEMLFDSCVTDSL
jgi:hypothetical protein